MTNARGIISATALLALLGLTGCSTGWLEVGASALDAVNYIDALGEPPPPAYYDAVGDFAELDAWGAWHFIEPMGWVWSPHVGPYWRPFSNGHWYWSDHGWAWWAYDPWGWATAHYGFWEHDAMLGWVWIPDWEWSPARVDWVLYEDHVCWAPLPWGEPWPDPWISGGGDYWVVVDYENFDAAGVGTYHRPSKFKGRHTPLRGRAPDHRVIERRNRRPIAPVVLEFKGTRRGDNDNTVQRLVYMPEPVVDDGDRIVVDAKFRTDAPRFRKQPNPGGLREYKPPRSVEWKEHEPGTREVKTRESKQRENTRSAKSRSGSGDSKKRKSRSKG